MFVFTVGLLANCNAPDYPSVMHAEDSAFSFVISEIGMEKFIDCGLKSAIQFAQMITIPELVFNLELALGINITFVLSDLRFADFSVGGVHVDVTENNPIAAEAYDADIELRFAWRFIQSGYPPLYDNGTGQVIMKGADLRVVVDVLCDFVECPGHLKVDVHRANLDLGNLYLLLDGGKSSLFQAFANLMIELLQDKISDVISKVMVTSITELMNSMLQSNGYYEEYAKYPDIIKDDRFAADMVAKQGYIEIQFSGYVYKFSNLSDQFINKTMLPGKTANMFNKELQFDLSRAGFNNFLYIFHKYHDVFSKQGSFKVVDTPVITFYNVQSLLTLDIEKNGAVHQVQLSGVPKLRTDVIHNKTGYSTHNVTQIFFKFQVYSSDLQNEENEEVVEWINKQVEHANYQIANTPFMDMDLMDFVFDPKQDVLRLVGDNPEECRQM
ncbi:Conserved_hypothetical protein [Hexamita inflata]|uniref:Uncharacterized protein n=1 Tax=Hexamita inflata TaxID=28002 RepID=A0AA86PYX3_9EUKA|nr:Conserved hypothetical protein [Hexamita inflata]